MKVERKLLLETLKIVSLGLSDKEMLEQSNCFVFHDGCVHAFNDEVYAYAKGLSGVSAAVNAQTLLKALAKFPDDDLEFTFSDSELEISGDSHKRAAGIPIETDIRLPYESVPKLKGKPKAIPEGVSAHLLQASCVCGNDEMQPTTMCVRACPKLIEATDNYRMYRVETPTGFPSECLIPARIVHALGAFNAATVAVNDGWVYFGIGDATVAVRGVAVAKYPELSALLDVKGGKAITLPANLPEILDRAAVMTEGEHDARVLVSIRDGELHLESRSVDVGWYRERRAVDYKGGELCFEIHPKFFSDALEHALSVTVGQGRLKLKTEAGADVVVATQVPATSHKSDVIADSETPF